MTFKYEPVEEPSNVELLIQGAHDLAQDACEVDAFELIVQNLSLTGSQEPL